MKVKLLEKPAEHLPSDTKRYWNSATTSKKKNMEYWDLLEEITTEYLEKLGKEGFPIFEFEEEPSSDDWDLVKTVLEFAVKELEARGTKFPYVDENY